MRDPASDYSGDAIFFGSSGNGNARHGGVRRRDQLEEWLEAQHPGRIVRIHFGEVPHGGVRWSILASCIVGIRAFTHLLTGRLSLRGAARYFLYGGRLLTWIRALKPARIFFQGGPESQCLMPDVAILGRVPYVIFPDNVEFLVPDRSQSSFWRIGGAFAWEVASYRRAERVVAISHFDAAVIRSVGVDAEILPYYPDRRTAEELSNIADMRSLKNPERFFLMVGTALNPPTRKGMGDFLNGIATDGTGDLEIVVAGYGTEVLKGQSIEGLAILGPVDQAVMRDLQSRCRGLLISARQTSGFLTRIVEANLAGIPVLVMGDYEQSRGLEEYGIFQVGNVGQLRAWSRPVSEPFRKFSRP